MLLVRLRSEGKDGKAIAQMVYEAFQDNVEARVRAEGVKVWYRSDETVSCEHAYISCTLLHMSLPCVANAVPHMHSAQCTDSRRHTEV